MTPVTAPTLAAFPMKAEAGSDPQAFIIATLSDPTAPDRDTFRLTTRAAVNHPASRITGTFTGSVHVDIRASADQARNQIKSQLKQFAVNLLVPNGVKVAKDR